LAGPAVQPPQRGRPAYDDPGREWRRIVTGVRAGGAGRDVLALGVPGRSQVGTRAGGHQP
ncbi:MAG TPA: hypothetical protein PL137_20090, partial [Nocardioides sp.]|nr:hypothetical protein [Nocardioides sp.]